MAKDQLPTDLEGCTKGAKHCHGRRRGPERLTPEGRHRLCHRPAGWRTSHPGFGTCTLHAGGTKQAEKHAARLETAEVMATYGGPVDIDPAKALLDEVQRTAGHVEWLGRVLAALPPEEITFGRYEEIRKPSPDADGTVSMVAEEIKSRAGAHMIVQLYQQERKHLVMVSRAAIEAGASQRMVDMFTTVGQAYVNMIERILDRLDLSPEQAAQVPTLIMGELEQISRGDSEQG
jgi:hypothetical protein